MSQPIILVFIRKTKTLDFLMSNFQKLPFEKIIKIHNIDDKEYSIKRFFSKHRWLNIETLFTFGILLVIFAFLRHAWIAAGVMTTLLIVSNLLLIPLERFNRTRDSLIQRYKSLVMRGETLVLVECDPKNFERFIKIIQKVQDEPIAFFSTQGNEKKEEIRTKEMLPHPPETNDELEKQAKGLAGTHVTVTYQKNLSEDFLSKVQSLSTTYNESYEQLSNLASYNENILLSAEWLLDNSYTVKQSISDVQKNLPENYFRELPFIAEGPYKSMPTLYPLVSRIIAASDGRITDENITLFLNAYQEIRPLTMGELWAFPLIMKIRLIECLVDLTAKILVRVKENQLADFWANRILYASRIDSEKFYSILSLLSKEIPYPTTYFADQLMIQLTDTEAANTVLIGWLQRKVGENLQDIIQVEQSRQTFEQTSIANVISSLRRLEQMSWRDVFENISLVEKILSQDPASIYSSMDFPTKDTYRHAVEKLAKDKKISEESVAELTVELSKAETLPLKRHVGYYLIDQGKESLEKAISYHPTFWQNVLRFLKKHRTEVYLSSCLGLAFVFAGFFLYAVGMTSVPLWLTGSLFVLSAILFSELTIQLVNYAIAHLIPPNILPKMLYEEGIPQQYRTLVVIPTLLSSEEGIQSELEKLEIHFLANTDSQIGFGILSDFTDSAAETNEGDNKLLQIARDGIKYLNTKYSGQNFYLFHRNRKQNEAENCWMGWERKRGKLENLNCFLCGSQDPSLDSFLQEGEISYLADISYILTADSDTQLPKNSIRRLIETLSHPLNTGYLDPKTKKLSRGYTLIQPRVSTNYLCSNSTWFAKLFSDPSGIDPYTKSTSDIYQDLFDEGVYHGKGLYDYKLFNEVLSERLPENQVLSHDLLEGSYVSVAFASDIEFYDSFPETYALYAKRQHRWVRGDWQLISWLKGTVPTVNKKREENPLSLINRWKIFDNLRRSLLPISILAILFLSWLTPFFLPWTLLAVVVTALPMILRIIDLSWITLTTKLNSVWSDLYKGLVKTVISFAFIPHQAWINADAICKTLYRQHFSHKNLLQWTVSSSITKKDTVTCFWQLGVIALIALGLVATVVFFVNPGAFLEIPILALWIASPFICAFLNRPYCDSEKTPLSANSEQYIRLLARKTWRYFDDFVNEETHYLPPDNYQEKLKIEVAYRTSPTNIGLYLMSTISAYRFGYITLESVIQRFQETVSTLQALERYEGHFLNWYDIKNISPLLPKYVSTVDSGNLLASFWTVEEKCKATIDELLFDPASIIFAIKDNLQLYHEAIYENNTKESLNLNLIIKSIRLSPEFFKIDLENLKFAVQSKIESNQQLSSFPLEALYWLERLNSFLNVTISWIEKTMPWLGLFSQPVGQKILSMHSEGINWKNIANAQIPTLQSLLSRNTPGIIPFLGWIQTLSKEKLDKEVSSWIRDFQDKMNQCFSFAEKFKEKIDFLVQDIQKISSEMNLSFLYNTERKLFSIGYNVSDQRIDSSCYDLLASECRLASFIAIAKGDVPLEHWWALGRPTTEAFGIVVLQSWGGTMFEYLMPVIWCKNFNNTLLDYACKVAVECQIAYGNQLGIPWGISESAYSRLDIHNIYQYKAFGVPYLGLKHGLKDDFVITPYSSALALMIDPSASVKNLKRLDNKEMMKGPYGFFEAIDYSREYNPGGKHGIIIHTYMAHHLGMSISSFCNSLFQGYIQEFFHAHPRVKALESLLYERPDISDSKATGRTKEQVFPKLSTSTSSAGNSYFDSPLTPIPVTHLLSNGNYSIMVTNSGGGYSKYHNLDITRWRVDATCDNWGSCFYIRDIERNAFFSAASFPTGNSSSSSYGVNFSNHKIEIKKKDLGIEALTEIAVSPEDNVEIRCITLSNHALRYRQIEVTSYVEIALADHKADLMHPAFSKMFIETEAIDKYEGLLAHRRKRAPDDPERWCFHVAAINGDSISPFSYETRRDIFIGSDNTLANPEKVTNPLTNSQGYVLDPIFALRKKVRIEAGKRIKISFITGYANSREEALKLLEKYQNIGASLRVLDMAWTHAELDLRRLHITHDDAHLFQRLANFMIYPDIQLRASQEILKANRFSQQQLWGHGISGDNPILLVSIEDIYNLEVVHSALLAHAFWSLRGLKADLVVLNKEKTSYEQPLNEHLVRVVQSYAQYTGLNINGGIFLVETSKIAKEDVNLLLTVANAILIAERGSLSQQLATPRRTANIQSLLKIDSQIKEQPSPQLPFLELLFFNGLGGFTQDGKEYAIFYHQEKKNSAPWINVICNKNFGFLASARGLGMTWNGNSQSNRVTPWSNDSTLNPITDICYIRDDETGKFWTVASAPISENDAFRTRHGNGYTVYEHNSHAIDQEITVFVPLDESHTPVRVQILKLTNRSTRKRKLSIFTYVELTLAQEREESQRYIETSWNYETNSLMAVNHYRAQFSDQVAFLSCYPPPASFTGSRKDFIGRNKTTSDPDALKRTRLSQRTGIAMDPCFALQTTVELYVDESTEIVVVLGECNHRAKAKEICYHYQNLKNAHFALDAVKASWDKLFSKVQVKTPDQSLDLIFNRWLTYQNLSCRMWGRSAFYQSGGAYGFRDQLQDAAALVYLDSSITKEQILKSAARQFIEGDVQHWWHAETGSGVRTRISDDLLWLPYVVMHYIQVTGDESIMDIEVPYIEGRLLNDNELEAIVIPTTSEIRGTIKEHCLKAIEKSMGVGVHGLPFIGTGDWNDGMNLVGEKGRGESVWLGWFLVFILKEMSTWLISKHDHATAEILSSHAQKILDSIEENAWDGAWYLRAFFDDGTPIGSHESKEDKIDSLSQSWAVINGIDTERVKTAMESVEKYLIDEVNKIVLLFTPPYDKADESPGYIKGYPPGVRENGGQYTHAAVWVAMAFAKRGEGDKAMHILQMINPINRTKSLEDVYKYRVEPYVTAADIYALPGQEGRGGWTWYTGSASLMYRTILEDVLGFKLQGDFLLMDPSIPSAWDAFTLTYQHGEAFYEIAIENPEHVCKGVISIELDHQNIKDQKIPLVRESGKHFVKIIMGKQHH